MGTSSSYGGPKDGLIPDWLNQPTPPPSGPDGSPPAGPNGSSPDSPPALSPQAAPVPMPALSVGGSLRGPRTAFSRFAGGGSRSRLDSGLGGYVGAVGGSRGAARRMGSSRGSAANVLGLIRDIRSVGPAGALARFNLQTLAGRPADEVFIRLLDQLCPVGGTVDEAIARQGMLQAIDKLAEANLTFEQLTAEQLEEFVSDFVTATIEARVLNDIGVRGIALPEDVGAVDNIQGQLHDAISGCVREAMAGQVQSVDGMKDADIAQLVDRLYEASFDLIAALAEAA